MITCKGDILQSGTPSSLGTYTVYAVRTALYHCTISGALAAC